MPIPLHSQIRPGTLVSIVLKQDQRSGRQVQGAVSQVLTRGNHPRGVKVRLSDGRIGRVQQLVGSSATNTQPLGQSSTQKRTSSMTDHNPWASDDSHTTGRNNQNQHYQQSQTPNPRDSQQGFYGDYQQSQQPQSHGYTSGQGYDNQSSYQSYNQPYSPPSGQPYEQSYGQQPTYNAWENMSGNPPLPARHPAHNTMPPQGVSRSDTDELLASQPDRAEQMEHMQAYEANANESVDDKNRAQLEREFPNIDGSLIAAIYGDTKDLSETREMLQELGRQ